jgi:hypothetical protein
MSVRWLIVPTLAYAFLAHDILNTLLLAALAVGLAVAQTRPEVPARARAYLPFLQVLAVFVFLGANVVVVSFVAVAAVAAYQQRESLIKALQPWWQVQQQISPGGRRAVAAVLSLPIGYLFGAAASGHEWTSTFLSIVVGTIITVLLLFTPPAAGHPIKGGLT